MSFDKKNGFKLAGVVLSGTLVFGSYASVAAAPEIGIPEEKNVQQAEEKTELIVFLNTEDAEKEQDSEEQENGPFDAQAVHSFEEAMAIFEEGEPSEEPGKLILEKKEVKKLLILCGETALSDEEREQAEALGIACMADTEYEAILKAQEEAAKAAAEKAEAEEAEAEKASEAPVIQLPSSTEEPPVLLWQAPEIIISAPAAEEGFQDTIVTEENTGILLPGFVAPIVEEEPKESEEVTVPALQEETQAEENEAAQETEEAEAVPSEEETEEVLTDEEPVMDLFAVFNGEEEVTVIEAEETTTDEVMAAAEVNVEDTDEKPAALTLPGMDLVGSGTSGVGGGNKPSQPSNSSGTAGNSSQNTAVQPVTPSAPSQPSASNQTSTPVRPSSQPVTPAKPSGSGVVVQTGDASHRSLWGLSAVFSGALAAHFALQWKRLMRSGK